MCNSVFQWFSNPQLVIENCFKSLKIKGKFGLQTSATLNPCENYSKIFSVLSTNQLTKNIFNSFKSPWNRFSTAEEYGSLFTNQGFKLLFNEISTNNAELSVDQVIKSFESGLAFGYYNPANYEVQFDNNYLLNFKKIFRQEIKKQLNSNGKIDLIYKRLFLIAEKP